MPRVLLFAHASPASWVAYYIKAFRAVSDLRVVGPPPGAEQLAAWNRASLEQAVPTIDHPQDLNADFDLSATLGAWTPEVAIGISGIGGDGLYRRMMDLSCPTAYVTVDTWQCLTNYPEARDYDFVFSAQREFVAPLRDTGARQTRWLPLAADLDAHAPATATATHDIAFAGSTRAPVHAARRHLLEALAGRFALYHAEHAFGTALSEAFARGRIAFNHSAVQEVNMRIFEVMAMGRPLLTNDAATINGLSDLFVPGEQLALYRDEDDLMKMAARLLADDAGRQRMAEAGQREVRARHTYAHRAATILDCLKPWIGWKTDTGGILDWLPPEPGTVIDIGMALPASKLALHARGADRCIGIAGPTDDAMTRRGSYDVAYAWPGPEGLAADTAFVSGTLPRESALACAHACLRPGGTLLLHGVEDGHLAGTDLLRQGFHLRRVRDTPEGRHVEARRRSRALRTIADALFTRLAVPELDLPALIARIPEDW